MGVSYLVPTLGRPTLADVQADFETFSIGRGAADQICTALGGTMTEALRLALERTHRPILRNCADDDRYPPEANRRAAEVMEASDIDVLVTGGIKYLPDGSNLSICVPRGANYGRSVDDVARYGACGSGLFMRRTAVEKYGLLDYDGWRIDNFIVLKAISSGAKVRFCRLDTYRHRVSLSDPGDGLRKGHAAEKLALFEHFGVKAGHQPYEDPPVWDGELA